MTLKHLDCDCITCSSGAVALLQKYDEAERNLTRLKNVSSYSSSAKLYSRIRSTIKALRS